MLKQQPNAYFVSLIITQNVAAKMTPYHESKGAIMSLSFPFLAHLLSPEDNWNINGFQLSHTKTSITALLTIKVMAAVIIPWHIWGLGWIRVSTKPGIQSSVPNDKRKLFWYDLIDNGINCFYHTLSDYYWGLNKYLNWMVKNLFRLTF